MDKMKHAAILGVVAALLLVGAGCAELVKKETPELPNIYVTQPAPPQLVLPSEPATSDVAPAVTVATTDIVTSDNATTDVTSDNATTDATPPTTAATTDTAQN